MNAAAERAILLAIAYEWTHLAEIYRPWGVWIHRHAPLPPDASELATPINSAWFLDEHGLRRQDVSSYERYLYLIHANLPGYEMQLRKNNRRTYEIGLAGFAPYQVGDAAYLETLWAPLWARGRRVVYNEQSGRLERLRGLWQA